MESAVNHDLVVHDPSGRLVAAFEVRAVTDRDLAWATQYRRNLLEAFGEPPADFFGIITPSRLFLWRQDGATPLDHSPQYEIDMTEWWSELPAEALQGWAFELTVLSLLSDWLDPMTRIDWPDLERTGLLEAFEGRPLSIDLAA